MGSGSAGNTEHSDCDSLRVLQVSRAFPSQIPGAAVGDAVLPAQVLSVMLLQLQPLCHPLLPGSKGTSSHGNQCFVQAPQTWPCLVISWLVYSTFLPLLNISCILSPWEPCPLLWHQVRAGEQGGLCSGSPAGLRAQGSGQVTFAPWQETAAETSCFPSRPFPVPFEHSLSCRLCVQGGGAGPGCVFPGTRDCSMINNWGKIRPNEMSPRGLDLCGLHISSLGWNGYYSPVLQK